MLGSVSVIFVRALASDTVIHGVREVMFHGGGGNCEEELLVPTSEWLYVMDKSAALQRPPQKRFCGRFCGR